MPCIQIKTNVKTDEAAAEKIRRTLGSSICHLPGKSEDWLLVSIQDDCRMFFGGTGGRPIAMVEILILGESVDKEGSGHMTKDITAVLGNVLGIAPSDMYIRYAASPDWGWNGSNF